MQRQKPSRGRFHMGIFPARSSRATGLTRHAGNGLQSFIRRIPKREYPKYFDLERHFVEYAILPHNGTWCDAEVWRCAIEFNFPFVCPDAPLKPSNGEENTLLSSGLILSCTPNFRVSTIKRPEDANSLPPKTLVIRGVDMYGMDKSI